MNKNTNTTTEFNNIDAILESLEEQTKNVTIDDIDTSCPLWHGAMSLHLVSIDQAEKGFTLTFANDDNELMPSQFGGQVGNIWISDLANFIRSIKVALHMGATLTPREVIAELQKPHNIYLIVKTSIKSWGISMYNQIDFAQTSAL